MEATCTTFCVQREDLPAQKSGRLVRYDFQLWALAPASKLALQDAAPMLLQDCRRIISISTGLGCLSGLREHLETGSLEAVENIVLNCFLREESTERVVAIPGLWILSYCIYYIVLSARSCSARGAVLCSPHLPGCGAGCFGGIGCLTGVAVALDQTGGRGQARDGSGTSLSRAR